jgi:TatD DNase family protein
MLVETDSPYLAPIPFRGKTNQPAYVRHTAQEIANLRGISLDELAQATTQNFFNLFKDAQPCS